MVHINSSVAGLVAALVLGKRIGFGRDNLAPHNLTYTIIGASLLWFGWFGFNAGSALAADGAAATFVLLKAIDMTLGLRVDEEDEREGLGIRLHGESVS